MCTANSKGLSTKPNHSEINSSKYWGRSRKKIRVTTKTKNIIDEGTTNKGYFFSLFLL